MSERKVLNKYYPPDYDPSRIPRVKGERSKQFDIRVMAPFNMRCDSCGEYIYKGKKFNSRMENVEGESYLGIPIRRFYIKCPRCVSEITFRTDPEGVDYLPEHGSTRLFEALRTAEKMAEAEEKRRLEEEADNPMKQLEKRTTASQREIEALEALEELKEMNVRYASLDHEKLIGDSKNDEKEKVNAKMLELLQEEEDERIVKEAFAKKREHLSSDSDEDAAGNDAEKTKTVQSWKRVKGSTSELSNDKNNQTQKTRLKGLIVQRPPPTSSTTTATATCRQTKKPSSGLLNLQYGSSSDEDSK